MRIGVFTKIFPGTSPGIVLRAARDAGFCSVQYNMSCSGLTSLPEAVPFSVAEAVANAATHAGISIEAISATYNMIHPDPAVRRRGLRSLDAIAAQAAAMGTPLLTLCTGTRDPNDQWRYHPDNFSPEAWRDLLEACHDALHVAETHDIELAIEPEPANVIRSAGDARRLIDTLGSPRLKIVLDPANLVEGAPRARWPRIIEEAVELLADRIVLAHAKDRTVDGVVTAPGHGEIDFGHVVGCLHRAGFSGPVVAHGFMADDARSVARMLSSITNNLTA